MNATECIRCGHPKARHWAIGQHLCGVGNGSNGSLWGGKACDCAGFTVEPEPQPPVPRRVLAGPSYCLTHAGICEEDASTCDFAADQEGDCELTPLFYESYPISHVTQRSPL